METTPSLQEARRIAAGGNYDVLPVRAELLSDFTTPIEVLRALKAASSHCFLLESAAASEAWGRWSFLGFEPRLEVTCAAGEVASGGIRERTDNPCAHIRRILGHWRSPRIEGHPPFTGGLVGYFAWDFLGYREPVARRCLPGGGEEKDLDLMLFDKVVAFDHLRQKIVLVVNMALDDVDSGYRETQAQLERLARLVVSGPRPRGPGGRLLGGVTPLFGRREFCEMVERAKGHIREGDVFQVVLSNRLSAPFEGSLLDAYRMLRTINPSPYMFYLSGTDVEVAGASPETLVRLDGRTLRTFPLAGTRPRGRTEAEDRALEAELLSDEKELAEHNMLVDLGRNDLGKISEFGSVRVEALRSVERFSHVMHIGSTVRSEIREEFDALDAIEAVLPAGTLSGAPKIRACQLISELEDTRRGVYGGAFGYIDLTGNMDTCIAIRIACRREGRVFVQSGAGIVADSVAEREYEECMNKARATLRALELAQEAGP